MYPPIHTALLVYVIVSCNSNILLESYVVIVIVIVIEIIYCNSNIANISNN